MERERDVEAWLKAQIEKMGGTALKLVSPGNAGVPDRIVILPGGRIWFIELKKAGAKPRVLQVWWQRRLQSLGCNVAVIAGKDEARAWLQEVASL